MSAQINKLPPTTARHVYRFCSNLLPNEASFRGDFLVGSRTYERAPTPDRSRTQHGKLSTTARLLVFYARKNPGVCRNYSRPVSAPNTPLECHKRTQRLL